MTPWAHWLVMSECNAAVPGKEIPQSCASCPRHGNIACPKWVSPLLPKDFSENRVDLPLQRRLDRGDFKLWPSVKLLGPRGCADQNFERAYDV